MEPKRSDNDVTTLLRRIEELERTQRKSDAELAVARTLLAETWGEHEIPAEPIPAALTHALHGPRQTVRLVIDGEPILVGVHAKRPADAARDVEVWAAVLKFAREETCADG